MRVFAIVLRMSDNSVDPSGNTEAFRAFTQDAPQEQQAPASTTPIMIIVGVVAVVVAIIAVVLWIA